MWCSGVAVVVVGTVIKSTKSSLFAHFWQGAHPLRLPCETTSERPKVARDRQFLTLLTSKCASRHNGVRFFNIATSKSVPNMVCFVHFDFHMCFAPQWRALFRHLNFEKCSENGVLCTF